MNYKKILLNTLLSVLVLFLFSCVSHKNTLYLQNKNKKKQEVYQLPPMSDVTINLNDELYINVNSLDEKAYNFFSNHIEKSSGNSESSVILESYTVNNKGYIILPILGEFYVKDLSLYETSQKIEDSLKSYLHEPSVVVKKVNKNISVIGEVSRPGKYIYTKNKINILEAIAMAGDVSQYGNRRKVSILREEEGVIYKQEINLTKDKLLNSQYYYLVSNDIIYVEPLWAKKIGIQTFPFTLILSALTTFILLSNYLK